MASATGCRSPPGPTRFGPKRTWMKAQTLRSPKVKTRAAFMTTIKRTAMPRSVMTTSARKASPSAPVRKIRSSLI